ncbi:hypothetical protein BKA60DRAFT_174630 [Fusarium oxysporum]|nr:hypothetical protein BKA60DRAFT_174630 [Fusarium oxysporum]
MPSLPNLEESGCSISCKSFGTAARRDSLILKHVPRPVSLLYQLPLVMGPIPTFAARAPSPFGSFRSLGQYKNIWKHLSCCKRMRQKLNCNECNLGALPPCLLFTWSHETSKPDAASIPLGVHRQRFFHLHHPLTNGIGHETNRVSCPTMQCFHGSISPLTSMLECSYVATTYAALPFLPALLKSASISERSITYLLLSDVW